jgi:hypothetical protein
MVPVNGITREDPELDASGKNGASRCDSFAKSGRILFSQQPELRGGATMKSVFDILEKIDEVNFRWLEATQDLQSAKFRIEEREALSPGEYVIFDRRTQQIVAKSNLKLHCAILPPKD